MGSIINQILIAEDQASQLVKDAAAKAKSRVNAARENAEKELKKAEEILRKKALEEAVGAEAEGKALALDIRARRANETDKACALARKKIPEAVNYLLTRIGKC